MKLESFSSNVSKTNNTTIKREKNRLPPVYKGLRDIQPLKEGDTVTINSTVTNGLSIYETYKKKIYGALRYNGRIGIVPFLILFMISTL